MRDAERRLFRCIGSIDDELILEAATARFQPKRWGHLVALAACLALILTVPTFLNRSKGGPEAAPETPNTGLAQGYEGAALDGNPYNLSLGGVTLGMTEEEVLAILGEPMDRENGWLNYNGISIEISQFLPQVISMDLRNGSLTLPTGIGPGSTENELLKAYPDLERNDNHKETMILYALEQSDQRMTVGVQDGKVVRVIVEQTRNLMLDALTVPEITIHQWIGKQWESTTVTDKAAKYICTILTISEPEEASGEKTGVSTWLDFGNGTAVELYGSDRASVWTYDGSFNPYRADVLTWQLSGVFDGLDDYVAQALADPHAGWD